MTEQRSDAVTAGIAALILGAIALVFLYMPFYTLPINENLGAFELALLDKFDLMGLAAWMILGGSVLSIVFGIIGAAAAYGGGKISYPMGAIGAMVYVGGILIAVGGVIALALIFDGPGSSWGGQVGWGPFAEIIVGAIVFGAGREISQS